MDTQTNATPAAPKGLLATLMAAKKAAPAGGTPAATASAPATDLSGQPVQGTVASVATQLYRINGLVAANLADAGYTANPAAMEAEQGFLRVYSRNVCFDAEAITAGLDGPIQTNIGFNPVKGPRFSRDYPLADFHRHVAEAGLVVQHQFGGYDLAPAGDDYAVTVLALG